MAVEVDELHLNLNKLLDDICKFLHDKSNYEKLSPHAQKTADQLINRCKIQLQEIAKLTLDNEEYDGAYVDMERRAAQNNEDKNNIYSSVDETPVITTQTVVQPPSNPYANLPAKDLCQDFKYGNLSWKCKSFLRLPTTKRIYAGVHNNWLLVYSSEKDCKPLHTFDLKIHKAQTVIPKQSKNNPQDFEVICTMEEGKSYYFLALTHKDMLQWISHINKCYETLNKEETHISQPVEEDEETYDIIPEVTQDNMDDEEEIYHDIETYSPENHTNVPKPPDLPARRCIKPNMPLPSIPARESYGDSSESSTYDAVRSRESIESNNSFSEDDDEENIYEPFVSKPPEPKQNSNTIEKPKTPAKPANLPQKPRQLFMLKK